MIEGIVIVNEHPFHLPILHSINEMSFELRLMKRYEIHSIIPNQMMGEFWMMVIVGSDCICGNCVVMDK